VNIYCQKVNFSGVRQWTANGVLLSNPSRVQVNPNIVSDGYGGGIVAWQDSVSGIWDIYSQRITSAGVITWTTGGVAVGIAANNQTSVKNISDGLGGSIYAFQDRRSGDFDIYAYKLDWAGTVAMISESEENGPALKIYPNPSNGNLFIEVNCDDPAQVIVYDELGQIVIAEEIEPHTQQALYFDTPGAYFITLLHKDGSRTSQRVIVTR
jgi:hypothetical protein